MLAKSFKKTHAINSWINLILSTFIVVGVFASVARNLVAQPTEIVEEVGLKTFRMFTVLSNMLVGITASMSIPFAVDGIRQKNYHLPRWIVDLTLISVSSITLTFVISVFLLAPRAGFIPILLSGSNLFMHTLIPISAIVLFLFINPYHTVKLKTALLALLPVIAYAVTYFISAIAVGEENGGWRDHYHFQELMPWYYTAAIILALTFIISISLMAIHNRNHRRDKTATEKYYQTADEYALPTIEDAIEKLAKENKRYDAGGEIIVPRRIIKFLEKKYQSGNSLSYLCNVYLNEYLK